MDRGREEKVSEGGSEELGVGSEREKEEGERETPWRQ